MTLKSTIKSFSAKFLNSVGLLDLAWGSDPSWRILMYHRICNPEDLSYPIQAGMYVRPETFNAHCQFLKSNSNVISVDDLILKLQNREKIPKKTIAITFDDGWKDNLENAFPVLKGAGIPATLFLPTSFIDTNNLFWTDQIGRALRHTPEVFNGFSAFKDHNEETKLEIILKDLFSLPFAEREKRVLELTKALPENESREFLSWEEVSKLDYFGIKIGSHSHTHRLFQELSKKERKDELEESCRILKSKGLFTSRVFVFPGGSHTEEMGKECASVGYLASLKTNSKYNKNSLIFPRVGIHEDISNSIELFKYRLSLTKS